MVTDGRTNPFYAVVRDDGLNFAKNPKESVFMDRMSVM